MLNKVLTLIVLLMPSMAYAQDGRFTYVEPGMIVPFKGTLFDDAATAHLLTLPEYYQLQCDLELEYQIGLRTEEFTFERRDLQAQIDFLTTENKSIITQTDARIALLEQQVKRHNRNDRPWWLAAGVAIGIGLTVGITQATK